MSQWASPLIVALLSTNGTTDLRVINLRKLFGTRRWSNFTYKHVKIDMKVRISYEHDHQQVTTELKMK